jgi:protein dithiol:quinone oxidoreductase
VSAAARRDAWLAVSVAVTLLAIGSAVVSQHVYDMQPCPWCVLQRLIFVAIGVSAAIGLVWRTALGGRIAATLMAVLVACGIAAALWQHFVAAASASCNLTFADRVMGATGLNARWPELFAAYANCGDKVVLWGVPYEVYSLALFVVLGVATRSVWRVRGR